MRSETLAQATSALVNPKKKSVHTSLARRYRAHIRDRLVEAQNVHCVCNRYPPFWSRGRECPNQSMLSAPHPGESVWCHKTGVLGIQGAGNTACFVSGSCRGVGNSGLKVLEASSLAPPLYQTSLLRNGSSKCRGSHFSSKNSCSLPRWQNSVQRLVEWVLVCLRW